MIRFICFLSALLAVVVAGSHSPPVQAQPAPATPSTAVTPSTSDTARQVLAAARPSIIQIEGLYGANTAPTFHGTGFAVADGVFLTNYHVVSEHVLRPAKYRLGFRSPDGKSGGLTVLAIDVLNDLALVQASDHAPPPLRLAGEAQANGTRAFSIGYPLDVGLTITEGVYNGAIADSFTPRIHYSGALNGGMSGGPALNADGEVVGINVAGYLFSQLVSFLVPADRGLALLSRLPSAPPTADALKTAIGEQARSHSNALMSALEGPMTTQVSAGYTLPAKLGPFVECNVLADHANTATYETTRLRCDTKSAIYVKSNLNLGRVSWTHAIMTSTKLGPWRFAHQLSDLATASGSFGSPQHVGTLACENRTVALKGFNADTIICSRGYRRYPGLYDFTVRVISLDTMTEGVASHLDITGVEFKSGLAFIERFIRTMERAS